MSDDTSTAGSGSGELPLAERDAAHVPGHWLLARLGKRVLRPGGRELTERMLADAKIAGADVVELAPGLGRTAQEIVAAGPRSYTGVESDPSAADLTRRAIDGNGIVVSGDAAKTGLDDASVDVVIGEAMLTMQTDKHKAEIAAEAHRVLRQGGRYVIHELAIEPDNVADEVKTEIRQALARSIKVNARPLTAQEWKDLFVAAGFEVDTVGFAPMKLLDPTRILADEGVLGTLKFVSNVLRDSDARARVLQMRSVFTKYRDHLVAIEVVARKTAA
ncbi:MAG: methyltransferase domain-containing protein [Rhodococcus sp. (in: high G+C Gram-positive bacteria)]|uniref:class I SAM-dependent methyltransferase n=1 Tax=Rhodococcus sp. TaxID=1831 RepID=UPI003BB78265